MRKPLELATPDAMPEQGVPDRRWHLVMTKPANEALAESHLRRQGYGTYLPQLLQKTLRRSKWCDRVTALFPRYLFVQLDRSQSLSPIRSTVGVAKIVRFGVDYMPVPSHVIAGLQRNEDPHTGLHRLHTAQWFEPGDIVRIAAGSLTGLEGIFQSDDGNQRVTVLLNLLGRETRIQVEAGCVVPSAA